MFACFSISYYTMPVALTFAIGFYCFMFLGRSLTAWHLGDFGPNPDIPHEGMKKETPKSKAQLLRDKSIADLKEIAISCGLRFARVDARQDNLDPDTVFLYDPGHEVKHGENESMCDALLYYHGTTKNIIWKNMSPQAFRKMLLNFEPQCCVCWNEVKYAGGSCPKCNSTLCAFCIVS